MANAQLRVDQSIHIILAVVLSFVLGLAGVLHSLNHWRQVRKGQERRVMSAAMLVAPQAAALLRRHIDDPLHAWTRALKQTPSICLVAIHDKSGQIRAIETSSPVLARKAVWSKGVMSGLYEPATWNLTDGKGKEVFGASVPIIGAPGESPAGQLTMAFLADEEIAESGLPWWEFYLPMFAITLFAWRLGQRQIVRLVIQPFGHLGRLAAQDTSDLPVDRDDQIGLLAKQFKKLHTEIGHWREQAQKLELTLERKVESQTKGYLKEMRRIAVEIEIDPLTGTKNRRVIDSVFAPLVKDHIKRNVDLAVVIFDVDNFKIVNDTLGHSAGDDLLKFLGQLFTKAVRENDLAVRMGGDEFALILPETTARQAAHIARRLTALFGQIVKTLPEMGVAPSLSAGVAGLVMTKSTTGKQLLQAADEALYLAKGSGKSHVELAQPAPAEAAT